MSAGGAIRIRSAGPADAEALVPLLEQLGYPTEAGVVRARLGAYAASSTVLVAESDDRLLGFVGVAIHHDLVSGSEAAIEGFVVADGSRSRGIGAQLLAAAEAWASERGAPALCVRSNVVRDRAHAFYARHGYERVKSQHFFRKIWPQE